VFCPLVRMACCKCCCETKLGRECCGEGEAAVCCEEGESCCGGDCQPGPCGPCCFVDISGSYSFTFGSYSGSLLDGFWVGTTEYLTLACTETIAVCQVPQNEGLFIEFYDGTDSWQGSVDGDALTHPCTGQQSLAGSYTLTNCTTSATQALTIT
jgi:hypothetical protein